MGISRLDHAASAPALLRFALRVATRAQGWLPAGWLTFAGRVLNPLHSERFQFTWSSSSPGILTLSFFPFQTTYYLNGHSFIEQELKRAQIGFRKNDNAFLAVDEPRCKPPPTG